jgi:hypothetical protein
MQIAIYAYLVYLLIFSIINLAIIYHVWKFSYPGDVSKIVLLLYSIIILSIVFGTFTLLKGAV